MATNVVQGGGYVPDGYVAPARHVDFLTSYPPGDMHDGQLWGPMREETKKRRHEAIAAAAYTLLAEKGYDGASMLSIARMAKRPPVNWPAPLPPSSLDGKNKIYPTRFLASCYSRKSKETAGALCPGFFMGSTTPAPEVVTGLCKITFGRWGTRPKLDVG